MITQAQKLKIFQSQVTNLRKLNQVRSHLFRSANLSLRSNDESALETTTRCLSLVFCSWVECSFSKLIHTPYGFELDEIEQIKRSDGRSRSVSDSWNTAVTLGLRKVEIGPGLRQNQRQAIERLVDTHVVEPSIIRNKIAHGQWEIALNRSNTDVNPELSNAISNIDIIKVERWFESHKHLSLLLEALIESPNRAYHRDFWVHVTNLEAYLKSTSSWNLAERKRRLQLKRLKRPN